MNHLIRTVASSAVLAALIACGSDESPPPPPPLAIQSVTPSSIGARAADFQILVVGTGFTLQSVILLGDLEFKHAGGSGIGAGTSYFAARIPAGTAGTTSPGTLSVSVKNPDGTRSNELSLVVSEAPAPLLSPITADLCAATDPVRFYVPGANFTLDTVLEINGQAVPVSGLTNTGFTASATRATLFPGGAPASLRVIVPAPGGGEATEQLASPDPQFCMD